MRLTDLSVRQLKAPDTGAKVYSDDVLTGFGVRVSTHGTASFVLTYGSARKRVTIGRVGVVSLQQARARAKTLLAKKTLGKGELPVLSFEEAFEKFQASHLPQNKPSTAKSTKRLLTVHFLPKFRKEKVGTITTADISDIIGKMAHTPAERSHAHAAIRLFFRWCEDAGYVEHSPVKRLKGGKPKSRSRVLSNEELAKVVDAAMKGTMPFDKLVMLLLLTGQRRGQIAALDRKWIGHNSRLITFPSEIMKGNREHVLPFGQFTAELLATLPEKGLLFPAEGTENPFSAFSKSKTAFDKACGVTDWTLHDLRRTMRTHFARLKVPPHIGERVLDHRTGIVSEVEAIYDRYEYLEEMRDAIERWEEHIAALLSE